MNHVLCETSSWRRWGLSSRYRAATQEWAVFQGGERITNWNRDENISFLQAVNRNHRKAACINRLRSAQDPLPYTHGAIAMQRKELQ